MYGLLIKAIFGVESGSHFEELLGDVHVNLYSLIWQSVCDFNILQKKAQTKEEMNEVMNFQMQV